MSKTTKLAALSKTQQTASEDKPRTSGVESIGAKTLTAYLQTAELEAIKKIQAEFFVHEESVPSTSAIIGAGIRAIAAMEFDDVSLAIQGRPDRRTK